MNYCDMIDCNEESKQNAIAYSINRENKNRCLTKRTYNSLYL